MANTPKGTVVKNRKTGDILLASGLRTFDPAQFEVGASLPGGSAPAKAQKAQGFLQPGESAQGFNQRTSGLPAGVRNPNEISIENIQKRGVTPGGGQPGGFQQGGLQQGFQPNQQAQLGALSTPSAPQASLAGGQQSPIDFQLRPGETPAQNQARVTAERQSRGILTVEQALGVAPQDVTRQTVSQFEQQAQQPGAQPGAPGGTPGTTPTTGNPELDKDVNDLTGFIEQLQSIIISLKTDSEKELDIETQLRNVMTSAQLGIEKVRQQPIATPFITGQSAAIQRQAALSAQPLQTQLADIQGKRQGALDVATTSLGFAESGLDRAEAKLQQQADTKREEASLSGTSSNFRTLAKILGRQPTQDELFDFIEQKGTAGRKQEVAGGGIARTTFSGQEITQEEVDVALDLIRRVQAGGGTRENAEQVLRGGGLNPSDFLVELDKIFGKGTTGSASTNTGVRIESPFGG